MKTACIIFPHQLFKEHPAILQGAEVFLVEESLFFNHYVFHKKKLLLHRASMKAYADFLETKKIKVRYIEAVNKLCDFTNLAAYLQEQQFTRLSITDPADNWLHKKIMAAVKKHGFTLSLTESPNFYCSLEDGKNHFKGKKKFFQTSFYIEQRKRKKLLLDESGGPLGGKWTYDEDNRKRFPKDEHVPVLHFPVPDQYVKEAAVYVDKHYKNNPGSTEHFIYPVNFPDAEKWLDEFIQNRLVHFGKYEDAIVSKEKFLYHSVLTPMLNIGLLDPGDIIIKVLQKGRSADIPLNSTEGFIRQVTGWRDFIRIVYMLKGSEQRTCNYWKFKRKIPPSFYTGKTGIEPIDNVIHKVLETGYCHHIERLMVLGNFMLLCEFDPDEVYRWFMELFIDAYDWVMVPNVYGMTQFADGGLMTTKPYISGSNYLMKMGDFKKGAWQEVWDALFWRFMHLRRDYFNTNPRLRMLVSSFDKMSEAKRNHLLQTAETYLSKLDHETKKS